MQKVQTEMGKLYKDLIFSEKVRQIRLVFARRNKIIWERGKFITRTKNKNSSLNIYSAYYINT